MKNLFLSLATLLPVFMTGTMAQCADDANIYSFEYNGKTYELVRENKSWIDAAACAVARGGYLAEINSAEEQDAVYTEIITNGAVDPDDTEAPDGYSSYVWLGGNDIYDEGNWIWNGKNEATGTSFWSGTSTGTAVNGHYNNWGLEPDNSAAGAGQDGLGLAIVDWPLGDAGQWNDVSHLNDLFFVIEFDAVMSTGNLDRADDIVVYPNPSSGMVYVTGAADMTTINVINLQGQVLMSRGAAEVASGIDLSAMGSGVYFITVNFLNGSAVQKKVVKQ